MTPNEPDTSTPDVSPLLVQASDAFYRDLPQLLKRHYRKWVAYHGDQCVGVGRTQTELYERCVRMGLKEGEFYIRLVSNMALHDHDDINIPDV